MGIIEVIPGAIFGTLTVKSREGNLNGETTWRCEDDKGRNIVYLESEIMSMYVNTEEVVPEKEPKDESEVVVRDTNPDPDSDCDEVPGGATVAQSEPEQEEERVTEEKPEPKVEKKKTFFGKKNKKK